ncbi:MAG TPA: hypothetical protein VJH24_03780 [Candidatus Bilamarchaeaceae archaeon]|nr:hypothetical protein [Candidatus Bilamarchaeaceae archaeon]
MAIFIVFLEFVIEILLAEPSRIGIDNKDGFSHRIQEDGIRGFFPDALHGEPFFS